MPSSIEFLNDYNQAYFYFEETVKAPLGGPTNCLVFRRNGVIQGQPIYLPVQSETPAIQLDFNGPVGTTGTLTATYTAPNPHTGEGIFSEDGTKYVPSFVMTPSVS